MNRVTCIKCGETHDANVFCSCTTEAEMEAHRRRLAGEYCKLSPIRPSRDLTFMDMAYLIARRATCPRLHVGAVIVKDGRVLSMGYNGSPSGEEHCDTVGCDLRGPTGGCVRSIHAEANAIAWAARAGISIDGSTIYCTHSPCLACCRLIQAAGIHSLAYGEWYRETELPPGMHTFPIVSTLVDRGFKTLTPDP